VEVQVSPAVHARFRSPRLRPDLAYRVLRVLNRWLMRSLWRIRAEGLENWPEPPFLLVVNHHNAFDGQILLSVSPLLPRITWFGPRNENFSKGVPNRLAVWHGGVIPILPNGTDLISAVRAVRELFAAGGVLGIFPEGRAGYRESAVLPFKAGALSFATRAGVPILPATVVGSNRLWLRARMMVRFGEPIPTAGVRGEEAVAALEARVRAGMEALLPTKEPVLPRFRPLERFLTTVLEGTIDRERRRVEQGL